MLSRFFDLVRDGVPAELAETESKAHKGGGSSTTNNEPPTWARPHLAAIGNMAGQLSTQPQQYYPGSTVVPFSNQSQQAMAGMEQFSRTDPGYARAGMDAMGRTAGGEFLNANPYLDEALNAATDPVKQQINSQFSLGGRYGSGSHAGVLADKLGGLRAQAYADNYARERENMMDAGKFMPVGQGLFDQSIMSRINAMGGVGSAIEGKAGEYLQDRMSRFDFAQNEPWNRVSRYASLINPGAGMGGTTTTTQPKGSALGGAAGGAMMGMQMGGPYGAMAGAVLGALMA